MISIQKIATRVFIFSSILFGVTGIAIVLSTSGADTRDSSLDEVLIRLLFANVFIILPSFAVSVAMKFLQQ